MAPTRHITRPLALFAASLLAGGLAATSTAAQALTLTVEFTDARSTQGSVNAALYSSDSTWLQTAQAAQIDKTDAAGDKTVLVFRNLEPGRYAISAYHDENGNGKLDTNVVGLPVERFGFTRDARGHMGPPAFGDAAVDLQADTTLRITLR